MPTAIRSPAPESFKKATTDPIQIRAWWKHREHLIGLPTGFASGVCCIDVDTSEDHADGVAEWDKLVAQHEPIVTREHRSATGGPHLIFDFDWPTGCSSGQLPKGIEVKGQGGYIVVPPSRRKGRAYTVHHDIDPDPLPLWLRDLITAGRQRRPRAFHGQGMEARPYCGRITADVEEVTEAMAWIPNDENVGWHDWKSMALRLYASLGDAGFKLFDTWSKLCKSKYNQDKTLEAWEQVIASPPDHTGAGAIFKIARHHGWTPRLFECTPTYPASDNDADTARREAAMRIDAFWQRAEAYHALMKEQPPPREPDDIFGVTDGGTDGPGTAGRGDARRHRHRQDRSGDHITCPRAAEWGGCRPRDHLHGGPALAGRQDLQTHHRAGHDRQDVPWPRR